MKPILLLCALALLPASAQAQTPPSRPAASLAMETLDLVKARRGVMFGGSSAGGLTLVARESTLRTSLFTQDRSRLTRTFRFLGVADAPILNGACILRTEGRSLLGFQWNQKTTQLYACAVEDQPQGQFALEVAVPAFKEGGFSLGSLSVSTQEDVPAAQQQAELKATLVYRGTTYQALPTGFEAQRGGGFAVMGSGQRRIVQGYRITRQGTELGRLTFNLRDPAAGTLTAPAAGTADREAVIFLALQLHAMPDLFSPNVREEIAAR